MATLKKLNGWQRLWVLFSIVWAIPVIAFTITTFPETKSEINSQWAKEKIDLLHRWHGSAPNANGETTAEYRHRQFKNATDEEIINSDDELFHGFNVSLGISEIDYSEISSEDQVNLKDGNLGKVSTNTLEYLNKQWKKGDWKSQDIFESLQLIFVTDIDTINKKYEARLARIQERSQFKAISEGALIWAVPLIVIYLLGIGAHWVYVGFHSKPSE